MKSSYSDCQSCPVPNLSPIIGPGTDCGSGFPQTDSSACFRIPFLSCPLIRCSFQNLKACSFTCFTYSWWFFQGPLHGTSCAMLHPLASTIAALGVFGH